MIRELTLKNFKSFGKPSLPPPLPPAPLPPGTIRLPKVPKEWAGETIKFGGLSLIIGTNASGKSNIRDGLRFIHGISRGYTLAEIMGERYGPGGELQWKGIRGGIFEAVIMESSSANKRFTLTIQTDVTVDKKAAVATYQITVDVGDKGKVPLIADESLSLSTESYKTFYTEEAVGPEQIRVRYRKRGSRKWLGPSKPIRSDKPAVTQLGDHPDCPDDVKHDCRRFLDSISSMRFLDLSPEALRKPSFRGQTVLGDKGENLSSVLDAICTATDSKESLIEWVRELTPLDVVDFEFPEVGLGGRIQLRLVEAGGRKVSAESASDGTLRFLSFAAALLGTDPAQLYFFEEIENGIHPNRAHLLVNLLQTTSRQGKFQVVGTTHSPALLNFLDHSVLKDSSLVYRAGPISRIRQFADIPSLWKIAAETSPGKLHAGGWFENTLAFLDAEGAA